MENGPTMSTLSPSASVRPTTCFVSWSANTAALATSRRTIHCARPAPSDQARSRALQCALVVDAERGVRNSLEPLLADRAAADRAESVRPVLDPAERRLDLDQKVLGVLLEPLVE